MKFLMVAITLATSAAACGKETGDTPRRVAAPSTAAVEADEATTTGPLVQTQGYSKPTAEHAADAIDAGSDLMNADDKAAAGILPDVQRGDRVGSATKPHPGMALAEFQANHPATSCFPYQDQTLCELQQPSTEDCPWSEQCRDVTYKFADGKLTGFSASYLESDWRRLKAAAEVEYGETSVDHFPQIGGMSMQKWSWNIDAGELSFLQFMGTDMNGNPLSRPFIIGLAKLVPATPPK